MKAQLTLTFAMDLEGVEASQFADMVVALQDQGYSDGRHDFFSEMLIHALAHRVRRAVRHSFDEINTKKYEGEYVPHYDEKGRENGKSARWCLETEENMKAVQIYISGDEPQKATIVEVQDVRRQI